MIVEFSKVLIQSDDKVLSSEQTEPHIINGTRYNWIMKSEQMKVNETLREWIERKQEYISTHPNYSNVDGVVIYDWQPLLPVLQSNDEGQIYTWIDGDKLKLDSSGMIRFAYLDKTKKI